MQIPVVTEGAVLASVLVVQAISACIWNNQWPPSLESAPRTPALLSRLLSFTVTSLVCFSTNFNRQSTRIAWGLFSCPQPWLCVPS